MDPSYEKSYDVLKGIFTDFKAYFPDNYFHLGGDEVKYSCFDENPNL
jgi:hexosaminidase